MGSLFEKNIEAMKELREELSDAIIEYSKDKDKDKEFDDIIKKEARDGSDILVIVKEGKEYRMNSIYRPLAEAEKWCEQYNYNNLNMNIMMFGFGNGIFIRKLLEKTSKDTITYIYEPSIEIFYYVLQNFDISDLLLRENFAIYIQGINENQFFLNLATRLDWKNINTQTICYHPRYIELFEEKYFEYVDIIAKCTEIAVTNKNTIIYFAESSIKNELANLQYLPDSNCISDFIGKFDEDIPAIVVAAGPSLDDNIDMLKKAEGKALIVATDTAVRSLLKHDIKFDCMVTVDARKPANYMNIPECRNIPLFCSMDSNNEIMKYHQGKKIFFRDSSFYLNRFYQKYSVLLMSQEWGASVANASMVISSVLGFKKIILVGQDLAYKNNVTHADGKISKIKNEEEGQCELEGMDGTMVKSRSDWQYYLSHFERFIKRNKDEIEIIDATEGGALIHGSTIMTLKEAIEKYCKKEVNSGKIFYEIPSTFVGKEKDIIQDILHVKKEFDNIEYKVKQALEYCDKALKEYEINSQSKKIEKYMSKLRTANTFIQKQNVYILLDDYISEDIEKVFSNINIMKEDEEENKLDTIKSARILYEAILGAVYKFADDVKEMVNAVEMLKIE